MGWALGSNDSANIFGTAVYSKMVRYRTAVILCAVFVMIGAYLEGSRGMETLSGLVDQTVESAFIASMAAAAAVTVMTVVNLPVSTSQAMVGAILGIGFVLGDINLQGLTKVLICWVGTPVGSMVMVILFYVSIGLLLDRIPMTIFMRDAVLRIGLVAVGSYGAYALGANNVANVTGVFIDTGQLTVRNAALLGGASIALGALTYSRNVMKTVDRKLVKLDPFSVFIEVLSSAVVVHIYALVGVPVSTSQAIIGYYWGRVRDRYHKGGKDHQQKNAPLCSQRLGYQPPGCRDTCLCRVWVHGAVEIGGAKNLIGCHIFLAYYKKLFC